MTSPAHNTSARLVSLDAFRGLTIAAMILVNSAGAWPGVYPQLRHAAWHGWTFTDTIFPSFLWIVGVAIALALTRRLERGDSRALLLRHIMRRAVVIFALGLLVYLWPRFDHLRIPGVLQRIALCYLAASFLFLYVSRRALVVWTAGMLAGYWLVVRVVPVPGYGAGVLDHAEGSLPQYLDLLLLRGFLYKPAWDPEGLLSTLPALATTLFGVLAGYLLQSRRKPAEITAWLFTAGNTLLLTGALLNIWLPINKNLWTSSFAVLMAGVSTSAFAFCYWVLDVQKWRAWSKPFVVLGSNAIAVYMLAELTESTLAATRVSGVPLSRYLFERGYTAVFGSGLDSLLWGLTLDALLLAVAWLLYRRKWFLRA